METPGNGDYKIGDTTFGKFYSEKYAGTVRLMKRLGMTDAEDAAQEAFMRLHRKRDLFRGESRLKTYFYRICINYAVSEMRKNSYKMRNNFDSVDAVDYADGRAESGERRVTIEQIRRALAAATEEIGPEANRLIYKRFWGEMPYKDIAEDENIPLGTMKSRLNRAFGKMKKRIPESVDLIRMN